MPQELSAALVLFVVLVLGSIGYAIARARREKRDEATLAKSKSMETHLPASLHPVIDPTICIGSLSCVKACPEGDILGIVDGAATLITGANCIGHARCALECPVDAIKLVFGTSERGIDLPEVDEVFESSRPGVHIVGELGGMGLIRNAMTQGVQVGEYLGGQLAKVRSGDKTVPAGSLYDVVIVGAGAGGLASALSCRAAGLSIKVLEQDTLGGTVAHYPRQKIVMTETIKLPIYGKFGKRLMSKQELLESFEAILEKAHIPLSTGVKVAGISGEDGDFLVRTDNGDFRARKVVLATGRRGSPRKIGVPGEELAKVTYRLIDPDQYEGSRVLVVGGGDSALEAAASLAEQGGVQVTIAYRGPNFVRSRIANQDRVNKLIAEGQVIGLFNTTVSEVRATEVVVETPEGKKRMPNDYVLALLGGELPVEFLKAAGIDMKRHFGEAGAHSRAHRKHGADEEERRRTILARVLFVVGAAIVGYLTWVGQDYYYMSALERKASPLHAALRSSGPWGHGVGLVATLFMLSNFIYAVRKRLMIFKGGSPIRTWLTWHMFVGFMSPLVIAFHAAFQSKNLLATSTTLSLLVVVGTGAIGRFIYGLVPAAHGKTIELGELRAQWERLRAAISEGEAGHALAAALPKGALEEPPRDRTLIGHLLRMPLEAIQWRIALQRTRTRLDPDRVDEVVEALAEARVVRTQIGFYRSLRRLLSWWRVLHIVLAVFLVFAIVVHVGVSIYLGYGIGWGSKS